VGELILSQPALKIAVASSVPIDLISAISLMVRATDEQRFDRWLVNARQELDPEVRHDLETLLGFSGRLLYYIDELLMSFDPFRPERLAASFEDYLAHLENLPAEDYRQMAIQALGRIHEDRGMMACVPFGESRSAWRAFIEPGITRANPEEVIDLVLAPEQLKARTVRLVERFWRECYKPEYERVRPDVQRALRRAQATSYRSVESAFEDLSGRRLPDEVQAALPRVARVTLCPSYHVGDFIQFILYPPELILYFNCQSDHAEDGDERHATGETDPSTDLLPCLRALSDGTRLRILEMLRDEELYAQEIVGRLGISQSAVSRHLATLESAGIVQVRPANGMKYYAINTSRLQRLATAIGRIG
jgi:DNA-binding transcriptional ArsR family regulator